MIEFKMSMKYPIEWISIALTVITLLILLSFIVRLICGAIPNRRVSISLIGLSVFIGIWKIFEVVNSYVRFGDMKWSNFVVKSWGNLSLLFSLLQNIEMMKLFSILLTKWTRRKLFYFQIFVIVFHLTLTSPYTVYQFFPVLRDVSFIGLGTFVVFHIACDTYIALYLSHVVQQDTMKPRDSQLAVDEKKLQTYALQLKRNLNFIFFCDIIGFGLYFIGILLPNNSPSGYALTESIQIIAGLQLCFKPILYGWIFMSMLVMKFSIDLRIKETGQKVKK